MKEDQLVLDGVLLNMTSYRDAASLWNSNWINQDDMDCYINTRPDLPWQYRTSTIPDTYTSPPRSSSLISPGRGIYPYATWWRTGVRSRVRVKVNHLPSRTTVSTASTRLHRLHLPYPVSFLVDHDLSVLCSDHQPLTLIFLYLALPAPSAGRPGALSSIARISRGWTPNY